MNLKTPIGNAAAIVFSASLDMRNYLRNQVSEGGFRAVCFENESICFDNFGTLQPEIVIAETDSAEVVWRFIFALDAINAGIPLVVVSDRLQVGCFLNKGVHVPVHTITRSQLRGDFLEKVSQITMQKRRAAKDSKYNSFPLLVGHTDVINRIRNMLPRIAGTREPVLIEGEPGTGKELLARLIVRMTEGDIEFIKIDCAELRDDRIADSTLLNVLDMGNKGRMRVILMDHLDQLSADSQAEILLLIQSSKMSENGSGENRNEAIRFIAASDQKIEALVQKGEFRKDLFYRINVIPITMPSLRERKSDIPMLMDYFIINNCTKNRKCVRILSQQEREICALHDWPGNVEELQNQMSRVAETGSAAHLLVNTYMNKKPQNKEFLLNSMAVEELPKSDEIQDYLPVPNNMSLKGICSQFVARTERRLMKMALESTSWNRKKAAELLNISYKSMLNKMKAYDIL